MATSMTDAEKRIAIEALQLAVAQRETDVGRTPSYGPGAERHEYFGAGGYSDPFRDENLDGSISSLKNKLNSLMQEETILERAEREHAVLVGASSKIRETVKLSPEAMAYLEPHLYKDEPIPAEEP